MNTATLTKERKIENAADNDVLRGRDILCFSHDWTGDPLSKTHLMRVLAKDNRICGSTPLLSDADHVVKRCFAYLRKLKSFTEPIREVEPNIFVFNPLAFPSYGNKSILRINQRFLAGQVRKAMRQLGFKTPSTWFLTGRGNDRRPAGESELIYYCVDDTRHLRASRTGLKEIEEDLFRRADLVIVSAEGCLNRKSTLTKTLLLSAMAPIGGIPYGAGFCNRIPKEIADLPRPVIGFHGLLADWVDYELIKKVAELLARAR